MKTLCRMTLALPLMAWGGENKGCTQATFTVSMPEQGAARLGAAFAVA